MLRLLDMLLFSVSSTSAAAPEVERNVPSPVTTITREDLERLPTGRRLEDLIRTCPAQTIPSISPNQFRVDGLPIDSGPNVELTCLKPDDLRMIEIFRQHNIARAEYGSAPLVWDPALARGAADYAGQLTTLGRVHAPREGRKDIRENLLQSLRGGRSPKQMVAVWVDEKRYFKPGVFPDVSTTGDWAKVGHYTQIIWPKTVRLGCAIHSDAKYDWTVCRYSPPGNRDGTPVLANDAATGVAPATSATPTAPPQQQPPPPPKASDPAPDGNEAKHPLLRYFTEANAWHRIFVDCGNTEEAEKEMARMRYALRELRKRLKTAKAAGSYSTVDVGKLEEEIKALELMIKTAEHRVPEDACPPSPPPRR